MQQEWDYFARNSGNLNSDGHAAMMRLRGARAAAKAGRYDEALEGYIWFHENAANEAGSRGVRLSFALRDWVKLAALYPPARVALEELRDRKAESLLNGFRDVEFFQDVVSINNHLDCERETYELFVKLNASSPQLARVYARFALPAIIYARDFELARQLMPSPDEELQRLGDMLRRQCEQGVSTTFIGYYARSLSRLLTLLRSVGDIEQAEQVLATALESLETREVREAVRAALEAADK